MIASRGVNMVRHPRDSFIRVIPIAGHTRKQSNSSALPSICKKVGTRCRSPSYERFLEGCSSPFMRLAEHLTALRVWCKQCLPGWRKPDVLRPGIVGMRGCMVIQLRPCKTEYTPPPAAPAPRLENQPSPHRLYDLQDIHIYI